MVFVINWLLCLNMNKRKLHGIENLLICLPAIILSSVSSHAPAPASFRAHILNSYDLSFTNFVAIMLVQFPAETPTLVHCVLFVSRTSTIYSMILLPPSFSGATQERTSESSVIPDTDVGARGADGTSANVLILLRREGRVC